MVFCRGTSWRRRRCLTLRRKGAAVGGSRVLTLLCSALQVLFPQRGTRTNSAPHQDNSERGEWGERQVIKLEFGEYVMVCCNTQLFIIKWISKLWLYFFKNLCFKLFYLLVIGLCVLGQTLQTSSWLTAFSLASSVGWWTRVAHFALEQNGNQRDRVGIVLKLWFIEDIFIFSKIWGKKVAEFKWYE